MTLRELIEHAKPSGEAFIRSEHGRILRIRLIRSQSYCGRLRRYRTVCALDGITISHAAAERFLVKIKTAISR